jgi:hypothetical protein
LWPIVAAVISTWAAGYAVADRLPYLSTGLAFRIRAFFIFPLVVAAMSHGAFVRTSKATAGKTAYRYMTDLMDLSRTERVKRTSVSIAGMILIAAGFACSTIQFPIWAAYLTASRPFARTYTVVRVRTLGGPVWTTMFDVTLSSADYVGTVNLTLTRRTYDQGSWQSGDVVCVRGRTSLFGTIAESTSRESCLGNAT